MKTLLTLLSLSSSVFALETRRVEVAFYCLKYAPGVENIQLLRDEQQVAVRLSTANLTNPVQVTAVDDVISVYRKTAQPERIGSIRIPAEINSALVVLVPGAGSDEPYRSLVLDRGDKFRLGTYKVINFSSHPIRGAIGRSFIETVAGGVDELELEGELGAVQGVKFEFFKDGRWSRLTETRAAVRRDRRWLMCVYQDAASGRILMRSIPDRSNLLVPPNQENETELTVTSISH